MSIWTRIAEALAALAKGEGLGAVFERLRSPPERRAGFAIAVIALGAKMAKADGRVTRGEVTAFREVFTIPASEERNAARVFNMARTDVAGYEDYARAVTRMFGRNSPTLHDLMEGLFYIAVADGDYHPLENAFLERVAQIMGLDERAFRAMRARFVPTAARDPYDVLGVDADAPLDQIQTAYRALVRQMHPDALAARGVPEEAQKLSEQRLVAINEAWTQVQAERAPADKPA